MRNTVKPTDTKIWRFTSPPYLARIFLILASRSILESRTSRSAFIKRKEEEELLLPSSMASPAAMEPDPGIPNKSVGTSAPPSFALLADSGAITPRTSPVP